MKGKTVVITGASSGIGRACAIRFAMEGSNVVITGRNAGKLIETETALSRIHPNILAVVSDVSNEKDCENIINKTVEKFGTIDVFISNAGISMRSLFSNTDVDVLKKVMDTNFWGTVYCTRYALPYLVRSKGSLVGISSIAGKIGLPGRTGYSASKFAMEGFLETIRTENIRNGVHVLVACPGFTASGIRNNALTGDGTPQGESPRDEKKMMPADTVADAIYDAVVKRKRDLVLTTQGKITLLLNKYFPGWLDKMVYNHMLKEDSSPLK